MTVRTWIKRIYVPSPGQPDAASRATTLSAALATSALAGEPRYQAYCTQLPCVILDMGTEVMGVPEPTDHAAVDAVQDSMLDDELPATVARVNTVGTDLVAAIAAHAVAVNPHSITPATIGAAPSSHTHVLADADIPAAIARDAEVAAAYAAIAHNHDAAYSGTAHTHAGAATGGAIRKTANQTMTATAQTAVTDMAFSVVANATYYFAMTLRVTTSTGTAPTTAWGFTGPANATAVAINSEQDVSTTQETKGVLAAFGNLAAGAQVANTGAEFRGVVQTGGTAGTVQLTCARGGTTPSMVIPAGCSGFWIRVA